VKSLVLIGANKLGRGPEDLGAQLMGSFLRKLWAAENRPDAIVFYNSGALLLSGGSTCLEALDGLAQRGVDLVLCGTCAAYYGIRNPPAGRISDMNEIVSLLMAGDKVVTV
jgi:intracellular sulfur oxidation DsrE/DsrF family protein